MQYNILLTAHPCLNLPPLPPQACTDIALQVPKQLFFEFAGGGDHSSGVSSAGGGTGGPLRQWLNHSHNPGVGDGGEDAGSDAWGVNLDVKELNVILKL